MKYFIDSRNIIIFLSLTAALMTDNKHTKVEIDKQLGDVIKRAKDDEKAESGKKKKTSRHNDGACGNDNPGDSDSN